MNIAVITGASSGIGKEFFVQLAKHPAYADIEEFWVIARRAERLVELRSETEKPVRVLALDLTNKECIREYAALLAETQSYVRVLVNASGFGRFHEFESMNIDDAYDMIALNSASLTAMVHATLPYMGAGCEVYNMGSLSSFQPVPYISVYGASKAYVLSFSRAVGRELKHRGIKMMAVCPGWVKTEFFDHAVSDDTITYYNRFYYPDQVVRRAIYDMLRGKDVSVCGFPVRMQVLGVKLLPHTAVMNIWCKQQKKD